MNSVKHLKPFYKSPVPGRFLASRLRNAPPAVRALVVLPFRNGTALDKLTNAQAARLADVGISTIKTVASASADERAALKNGGVTVKGIRRAHAHKPGVPTDAEIIDFVRRADPARVFGAIDALTTPVLTAAE